MTTGRDSLSIQVGDIYRDPTSDPNNPQMYIWVDDYYSQRINDLALVPNHSVAHVFTSTNRMGNYYDIQKGHGFDPDNTEMDIGGTGVRSQLTGRGVLGKPIKLKESDYFVDIETSIKAVERMNANDIKEISILKPRMHGADEMGAESLNIIVADSETLDKKPELKAALKLVETAKKKNWKFGGASGITELLGEHARSKGDAFYDIVDANEMIQLAKSEHNNDAEMYFRNMIAPHGSTKPRPGKHTFAFMKGGHPETGNVIKDAISNISHLAQSKDARVFAHNSIFEAEVFKKVAELNQDLHINDTRLFAATIIHQYAPNMDMERLSGLMHSKYSFMEKAYGRIGKSTIQEAFKTATSGMNSLKYKSGTSVEILYNMIQNVVYNDDGDFGFVPELHSGLPDNLMTADIMEDLQKFSKGIKHYAKENRITQSEAFEEKFIGTVLAREMHKSSMPDEDKMRILQDYKNQMVLRHKKGADSVSNMKKAVLNTTNEKMELLEKGIIPSSKKTGLLSETLHQTFGNSIGSLMGGVLLSTGVHYTIEKIQDKYNQVAAAMDPEGMNHNSIMTTINRLYRSEFGSSYLGVKFTGKLLTGAVKSFFTKQNATNIGEFGKSLSGFIKKGTAQKDTISELIAKGGRALREDFTFSGNKTVQKMGNKLASFADVPLNERFLDSIRDKTERSISFITGTIGTFREKQKTIVPWMGIGIGTMAAINVAAGSYSPVTTENRYTPIRPTDTYQKRKFREIEESQRKMALNYAMNLENKGMDDSRSSLDRRQRRASNTDFGSSRVPGNPTTMMYSNFMSREAVAWNIDDASKERAGLSNYAKMNVSRTYESEMLDNINMQIDSIKLEKSYSDDRQQEAIKNAIWDMETDQSVILPYAERSLLLQANDPNDLYFSNYESGARFKSGQNDYEVQQSARLAHSGKLGEMFNFSQLYNEEIYEPRNEGMSVEDIHRTIKQPRTMLDYADPDLKVAAVKIQDPEVLMQQLLAKNPNVNEIPQEVTIPVSTMPPLPGEFSNMNHGTPIDYKKIGNLISSKYKKIPVRDHMTEGGALSDYLSIPRSTISEIDSLDFVLATGGGTQKISKSGDMLLKNISGDGITGKYDKIEAWDMNSEYMGGLDRNGPKMLNSNQVSKLTIDRGNSIADHNSFGCSAGRAESFNSSVSINETGQSGGVGPDIHHGGSYD